MSIKKLETTTLADALTAMAIGETCIAPDGYTVGTVRRTCTDLKERGYLFRTSMRSGEQTITRLK